MSPRKWRRPATDWPDRAHAAGVADAVHAERERAEQEQREWYDKLVAEGVPDDEND